jgi:hypothetical protein
MKCPTCRNTGVASDGGPCLECENRAIFCAGEEFDGYVFAEWDE